MIHWFSEWFSTNSSQSERQGIRISLSESSKELSKNGISAVLKSERIEATVELWETGESEVYFLDWKASDRDPDYQPEVIHYDFENKTDLLNALNNIVSRMSLVMA